jgi:hypothetical protein
MPLLMAAVCCALGSPVSAQPKLPVRTIPPQQTIPLLGHPLIDSEGEEIGRLVDIIADDTGHPSVAITDIGGFFGIGSRRIAVDWTLLRFTRRENGWEIGVAASGAEVAAAPEYPGDGVKLNVLTAPR